MKNICDWNNCLEEGFYKAPVEKDNSKKYRILCLNHVKEFNKNWNYFEGMDDNQIYEFVKSDKKNNSSKINLILLKKIGKVILGSRYNESVIKKFLFKELIN